MTIAAKCTCGDNLYWCTGKGNCTKVLKTKSMSNQKELPKEVIKEAYNAIEGGVSKKWMADKVLQIAQSHYEPIIDRLKKDVLIESQKQEIEKLKGLLKDSRVTLYRAEGAYPDMYEELWEAYKKEHGIE